MSKIKIKALLYLAAFAIVCWILILVNSNAEAKSIEEDLINKLRQEQRYIDMTELYSEAEVNIMAKIVWAEARGLESDMEKAAVVWCILNRVDDERFGDSIKRVATAPNQFAYRKNAPVDEEIKNLVLDVLDRWILEKLGVESCGRILPKEYVFFHGARGHNWFKKQLRTTEYWNWDCQNPYED